jgi:hypothetical protein
VTGHVFHPGHSELHGVTVLLETENGVLYVGRYHEETPAGVLLHDVAEYREGSGGTAEEFLRRTLKFGVRATERNVLVPARTVRRVSRLVDWEGSPRA